MYTATEGTNHPTGERRRQDTRTWRAIIPQYLHIHLVQATDKQRLEVQSSIIMTFGVDLELAARFQSIQIEERNGLAHSQPVQ